MNMEEFGNDDQLESKERFPMHRHIAIHAVKAQSTQNENVKTLYSTAHIRILLHARE